MLYFKFAYLTLMLMQSECLQMGLVKYICTNACLAENIFIKRKQSVLFIVTGNGYVNPIELKFCKLSLSDNAWLVK